MKRLFFSAVIGIMIIVLTFFSSSALASEYIYGLKIENINSSGADFSWSTSIETEGSITYAYTKHPELYNPQAPGSHQEILLTATPALTKSEDGSRKDHHIKIDNLDLNYCPFVQYTIKSQAFSGETYEITGEFVLVDTGKIVWWQTWQFAIFAPIITLILGSVARPKWIMKIYKRIKSI